MVYHGLPSFSLLKNIRRTVKKTRCLLGFCVFRPSRLSRRLDRFWARDFAQVPHWGVGWGSTRSGKECPVSICFPEKWGSDFSCPPNPVIILPLRCLILSRVPGSRSRSRVARHAGDAGPTTGTSHQCCDWLGNPPKTCWDMTTHWVQSCPIWLVVWTSFRFSRKRRWRSPSHTESYLYKSTREPLDFSESWGAKTQHISTSSQTKVATGALPRKWSRDLLPRFAHAAAQLRAYPGDLSGEWWLMWLGRVVGVEYGWVIICDYHPKHGAWFEPPQMG